MIDRRNLLAGIGMAGLAGSPADGRPAQNVGRRRDPKPADDLEKRAAEGRGANRIDVHHHLIPPAWSASAERHGLKKVAGAPLPDWTPEKSLSVMNINGIQTAILSLSAPGVLFGDRAEARDVARASNDYAAELKVRRQGRFGSFAVLPMPFTDDAVREAIYALDTLHAEGVVLLGSTDGKFLGDPQFDELMAELDRRKAIVFVHPNIHPTSEQLGLQIPGFFVEFLCDTTRAATNMMFNGTLKKYRNIRFILAHAGGFLPYIAWRLSLANDMPEWAAKVPGGVLDAIRGFYFDTALSPAPWVLAALNELVDPSHILFGSDFPFAPAPAVGMERKSLEGLKNVSRPEKLAINRGNALELFPHFARFAGDPANASVGNKIKGAVTKPVVDLGDAIRKR
ncbi:amidohydrolase (plasmid) [Sphingomonas sp. NY01]|uniref:amidohydrolase family protein n=1 Tax=Sphingomonas sp. NY01 TaxID=2968057 RepID=UPI00315D7E9F